MAKYTKREFYNDAEKVLTGILFLAVVFVVVAFGIFLLNLHQL